MLRIVEIVSTEFRRRLLSVITLMQHAMALATDARGLQIKSLNIFVQAAWLMGEESQDENKILYNCSDYCRNCCLAYLLV